MITFGDLIFYIKNFDIILKVFKDTEILEVETNILSNHLNPYLKCPIRNIKVIKNKLVISVCALKN